MVEITIKIRLNSSGRYDIDSKEDDKRTLSVHDSPLEDAVRMATMKVRDSVAFFERELDRLLDLQESLGRGPASDDIREKLNEAKDLREKLKEK